jgi:hypothetical protein
MKSKRTQFLTAQVFFSFILGYTVNPSLEMYSSYKIEKIEKKKRSGEAWLSISGIFSPNVADVVGGFSCLNWLVYGIAPQLDRGVEPATARLLLLRPNLPSQPWQWRCPIGREISTYILSLRHNAVPAAGFIFIFIFFDCLSWSTANFFRTSLFI